MDSRNGIRAGFIVRDAIGCEVTVLGGEHCEGWKTGCR
jgi:hypothetical protein